MKTLFSVLIILFTLTLSAQDGPTVTSFTGLRANLGAFALVHEQRVGDKFALRGAVGVRQAIRFIDRGEDDVEAYYAIRPTASLAGRYYYNLGRRAAEGKVTTNNSGNFVGLALSHRFGRPLYSTNGDYRLVATSRAELQWGLRRQLGRRFDFELTLGLGLNPRSLNPLSLVDAVRLPRVGWSFGYRF